MPDKHKALRANMGIAIRLWLEAAFSRWAQNDSTILDPIYRPVVAIALENKASLDMILIFLVV